ncbi:MAG: lysophospholipase [Cyanobacteria bacterium P01_G01_bin.19]
MSVISIKHEQGKFLGVGNAQIYYQSWHPHQVPQGVVAIVHGLGAHSGIFGKLVQFLGDRNYTVYASDLRGHGRSDGQRGYINNWSEFREDLGIFHQLITAREANLPLFLLGQSLGETIALDYALQYSHLNLQGLILLSPALKANISPIRLILGKIFSSFYPRFSIDAGIDPRTGSRDPQVVAAYYQDTLRHTQGTARLSTEFFKTVVWIEANLDKLTVPLLLLHGGADKIILPESSRLFFSRVPFADKELHIYPHGYHELHNDLNYQRVFADLNAWLIKRNR